MDNKSLLLLGGLGVGAFLLMGRGRGGGGGGGGGLPYAEEFVPGTPADTFENFVPVWQTEYVDRIVRIRDRDKPAKSKAGFSLPDITTPGQNLITPTAREQYIIDRDPNINSYADLVTSTHIQTIEDTRGTSFDTGALRAQQAQAARRDAANRAAHDSANQRRAAGITNAQVTAAARIREATLRERGIGTRPGAGPGETTSLRTAQREAISAPKGLSLAEIRKRYGNTGGRRATGYGPSRGS